MIKFLDLEKINNRFRVEMDSEIKEILDSGWYLQGKKKMKNSQKTPTEIFNKLKNTYKDFTKTKVSFKSDGLNKEFEEILDDAIYTDPYIEHIAKYKFTGNSLEKDIKEDLKDKDLYEFLSYKDSLFPQDKNYRLQSFQVGLLVAQFV